MYELRQAGERTYYIDCPAKIGVYRLENGDAYLIDSGGDRSAGKKVLRILEEQGWKLKAIVNTHSHADHIGGNRYLQQQTGCKIFAAGVEAAFIRRTILEPAFLAGGSPCRELCHKFLLAEESQALDAADPAFPKELELIPLHGHSYDMAGFRTPDNVVFLGDCVSSPETLEKYGITYLYDVQEFLNTLDRVERLEASLFVPAHAEAAKDVRELVALNRRKVLEIGDKICGILREPMDFETLLKRLFDEYGLAINFQQYALVGSTVRSYTAWLKDSGRIAGEFRENRLLWSAVEKS